VITFDCWKEHTLDGFGGGHASTLLKAADGTHKLPLTFRKADASLLQVLAGSGALFGRKFLPESVGSELLALFR
jgi:hypothetical protein